MLVQLFMKQSMYLQQAINARQVIQKKYYLVADWRMFNDVSMNKS